MSNQRSGAVDGLIVGGIVFILMQFRFFRIVIGGAMLGLGLLYFYDAWGTEGTLDKSEYSFQMMPMGEGYASSLTPRFKIGYRFENHSDKFVQTVRLTGRLYNCDSIGQPISSCDYIDSRTTDMATNIRPGAVYETANQMFAFYKGPSNPKVVRAEFEVEKVIYDSDRTE
jgi:hypothetical protein